MISLLQNINSLCSDGQKPFFFFFCISLTFRFQSMLISISQAICQRLDSMEAKLQVLEATCRGLVEKLDTVMGKNQSTIQVPMVSGSPFGATQTCDKVRW